MDWIPVSRTHPYSSGEVLVTFQLGHNVYLVDIMTYDKDKKRFSWYKPFTRDMTDTVTAWMPVPTPYKK
jgi:hypothetical protein